MKLFLIKFRNIDNDKEVYDKLHELAGGISFLPLDSDTFVLMTDKSKKTVIGTLTFDLESNVLLVDISSNEASDFFVDNDFDNTHLGNFVEEFRNEANKTKLAPKEELSELDGLLDKISKLGIDELTGYEQNRLVVLSNPS
jgi:hypothetical protein